MQGCLVTLLMVIITAVQVMINQLATRGPLSSSTVTDSETDNDFLNDGGPRTDQTDHSCKIKPVPDTNIYTMHRQ